MVGPKPPGNPDQMLEGAGQLLSLVAELESQASAMAATKMSGGSGGFASAVASAAAGEAGQLRAAAASLQGASSAMRSGAAKLKAEQHAWELKVKRVAGQLEHEMRIAQQQKG